MIELSVTVHETTKCLSLTYWSQFKWIFDLKSSSRDDEIFVPDLHNSKDGEISVPDLHSSRDDEIFMPDLHNSRDADISVMVFQCEFKR